MLNTLLLILFIMLGAVVAGSGIFVGARTSHIAAGGKLIEYRALALAGSPVITPYVETAGYATLSVVTKAISPANGLAIVTVYGSRNGTSDVELQRIDSHDSSWTRWEQTIAYPRLRVTVEDPLPGEATPAGRVDVLLYLSP